MTDSTETPGDVMHFATAGLSTLAHLRALRNEVHRLRTVDEEAKRQYEEAEKAWVTATQPLWEQAARCVQDLKAAEEALAEDVIELYLTNGLTHPISGVNIKIGAVIATQHARRHVRVAAGPCFVLSPGCGVSRLGPASATRSAAIGCR